MDHRPRQRTDGAVVRTAGSDCVRPAGVLGGIAPGLAAALGLQRWPVSAGRPSHRLISALARRRCYPGRTALPDRLVLSGIVHVLHTRIAWEDLPQSTATARG